MDRSYYSNRIDVFCATAPELVLGEMVRRHGFDLNEFQRDAWLEQACILREDSVKRTTPSVIRPGNGRIGTFRNPAFRIV